MSSSEQQQQSSAIDQADEVDHVGGRSFDLAVDAICDVVEGTGGGEKVSKTAEPVDTLKAEALLAAAASSDAASSSLPVTTDGDTAITRSSSGTAAPPPEAAAPAAVAPAATPGASTSTSTRPPARDGEIYINKDGKRVRRVKRSEKRKKKEGQVAVMKEDEGTTHRQEEEERAMEKKNDATATSAPVAPTTSTPSISNTESEHDPNQSQKQKAAAAQRAAAAASAALLGTTPNVLSPRQAAAAELGYRVPREAAIEAGLDEKDGDRSDDNEEEDKLTSALEGRGGGGAASGADADGADEDWDMEYRTGRAKLREEELTGMLDREGQKQFASMDDEDDGNNDDDDDNAVGIKGEDEDWDEEASEKEYWDEEEDDRVHIDEEYDESFDNDNSNLDGININSQSSISKEDDEAAAHQTEQQQQPPSNGEHPIQMTSPPPPPPPTSQAFTDPAPVQKMNPFDDPSTTTISDNEAEEAPPLSKPPVEDEIMDPGDLRAIYSSNSNSVEPIDHKRRNLDEFDPLAVSPPSTNVSGMSAVTNHEATTQSLNSDAHPNLDSADIVNDVGMSPATAMASSESAAQAAHMAKQETKGQPGASAPKISKGAAIRQVVKDEFWSRAAVDQGEVAPDTIRKVSSGENLEQYPALLICDGGDAFPSPKMERVAKKREKVVQLMIFGMIGLVGGLLGSVFVQTACHFVTIEMGFPLHFGLWKYSPMDSMFQGYSYCYPYDDEYTNDSPVPARVAGIIALVAGTFSLVVLWVYLLMGQTSDGFWRWAVRMLMVAALFQALTFSFFVEDICLRNTCRMGPGSVVSLVSTLSWLLIAYEMKNNSPVNAVIPDPHADADANADADADTYADAATKKPSFWEMFEWSGKGGNKEDRDNGVIGGSTVEMGSYQPPVGVNV